MNPLRPLLRNLIDYAGLFPPSALSMPEAVGNYALYRDSPEAWMLARFVVPVSRFDEFETAMSRHDFSPPLSALIGANLDSDLVRIASSKYSIDTIELKASNAGEIESAMSHMPPNITAYFEITDLSLIPVLRDAAARAKIRTGGITPEAFPTAAHIAKFLKTCADRNVRFKATAGLHHPLRCHRPLTYSAEGPSGWMFGFLNVFLAAVLAHNGFRAQVVEAILVEESPAAFTFGEDSITWAGHQMTGNEIADARSRFAISFGSCSFEEPIAELKELKLI